MASSSKDRIGRKNSLNKVSLDMMEPASGVNSSNSFLRTVGYTSSSTRLHPPPLRTSYAIAIQGRSRIAEVGSTSSRSGTEVEEDGSSSSSHSGGTEVEEVRSTSSAPSAREVMALPIEVPDSVTDEDAFRRYLAVRRGANIDARPQFIFEDNQSSYESIEGSRPSRLPATMGLNNRRYKRSATLGIETTKRTMSLSFAIITLALLSASASQLRFLIAYSNAHSYPILNYFLVCISIIIEIFVGLGYVILSRFNFTEAHVETAQSYLISALFIVAICNVIIAAFAFDDHVCEVLAKQTEQFDTVDQSPS